MRRIHWRNPDAALLVLRVCVGLMMMVHGYGKWARFGEMADSFDDPFGLGPTVSLVLAIGAELGCSLLLLLGLATPLALVPLLVTMAVAILYAHGADPWSKKELAVLYFVIYASLLVSGPGRYSLDEKLFGSQGPPSSKA